MKTFLTALGALALSACIMQDDNPLQGREFTATQEEIKITLIFDEDEARLHGKVVNSYNAPYELVGDNLIISRMASTMMMPVGKAAAVEREYFKFMGDIEPKQYVIEGNTLTLIDHNKKEYKFTSVN